MEYTYDMLIEIKKLMLKNEMEKRLKEMEYFTKLLL